MIWHSYVIRNVHRTVAVSTLISEILTRFWSTSISFRKSTRSVQKINSDTTLINIDQRIYWWKISTTLINIDWLINLYTSQYSVFVLRSAFIKSVSWHDFHKSIDQVEDFFPCIAALSAKHTTSCLFVSMFICSFVCVISSVNFSPLHL